MAQGELSVPLTQWVSLSTVVCAGVAFSVHDPHPAPLADTDLHKPSGPSEETFCSFASLTSLFLVYQLTYGYEMPLLDSETLISSLLLNGAQSMP